MNMTIRMMILSMSAVTSAVLGSVTCDEWTPLVGPTNGVSGQIRCMTHWDPDGSGSQAPLLIVGGDFEFAGGIQVNGIAAWDGSSWSALGTGVGGADPRVFAVSVWDPDGDGVRGRELIVGGTFSTAGSIAALCIASWDGTDWQYLGAANGPVMALETWDRDGPGATPEELVAGGLFSSFGVATSPYVAANDTTGWRSLGLGMDSHVFSLQAWDPDGTGPISSLILAGGAFTTPGNKIAGWNGTTWSSLGGGPIIDRTILTMTVWDPDGFGPRLESPVIGGDFLSIQGEPMNRLAIWDGSVWQSLRENQQEPGIEGGVVALESWDPDGPGPLQRQLIAGGGWTIAGETLAPRIARWDGFRWHAFDSGMDDTVYAIVEAPSDLKSELPNRLFAGGTFLSASSFVASRVAAWNGCDGDPACPGDSNGDGLVDGADLSVLLAQFEDFVAAGSGSDFNSDGHVNGADLSVLLAAFGSDC